jgi:predicted nucleic acid-binding protein
MIYLLDANACIDHLRLGTNSYLTARLQTEPIGNLCLCSVVRSELIYLPYEGVTQRKVCRA